MRWGISISVLCIGAVLFEAQAYQESQETRSVQTQQPKSSESWSRSAVDSLFVFSNGKKICRRYGGMEIQDGKQVIWDFILRDCETGEELDGRGALEPCHLLFSNDTLWVNQLELLAMGEDLELVMYPWKIGAFYLEYGGFGYTEGLNENLRYDQHTIESVLEEYEATVLRTQEEDEEYVSFHLMDLANKLLIAAVSGSEKAEVYFKEFDTRVKPDGANASWYILMERILKYAREK